jgi:hypothetical protein
MAALRAPNLLIRCKARTHLLPELSNERSYVSAPAVIQSHIEAPSSGRDYPAREKVCRAIQGTLKWFLARVLVPPTISAALREGGYGGMSRPRALSGCFTSTYDHGTQRVTCEPPVKLIFYPVSSEAAPRTEKGDINTDLQSFLRKREL